MSSKAADYRLFFREFRTTFVTTGSVIPSGKALCRELARYVPGDGRPRRLLEVGPGTGVVTQEIIARLGPEDRLDVVELNERFVAALRRRLETESSWQAVADRVRIHHAPIQEFTGEAPYDAIVSGLPFANFPAELVAEVLAKLHEVAAPGATLSFFEYVALRNLRTLVVGSAERRRLHGVGQVINDARRQWGIGRRCIPANVPPAWVHHFRFPPAS
jgi:phospholipid N-methyltransferase